MAKRKKNSRRQQSKKQNKGGVFTDRRLLLKSAVLLLGGGTVVASLHAYDKNNHNLHDLSVIGNGQPAIVQIHDPSCPTCRRLKKVVSKAMLDLDGVNYRLADITTAEGKALQNRYNVPHVTLLYFDANGRHRHTSKGMLTPEQVQARVRRHLKVS